MPPKHKATSEWGGVVVTAGSLVTCRDDNAFRLLQFKWAQYSALTPLEAGRTLFVGEQHVVDAKRDAALVVNSLEKKQKRQDDDDLDDNDDLE